MADLARVSITTRLPVPAATAWERVTRFEGVNHELMPWLRMRPPAGYAGLSLEDASPGTDVGRVRILYGGFLPLDWDDLHIAEIEPGRRFLEQSSMGSMRVWRHERIVSPLPDGESEVTDNLAFAPRAALRPLRPALHRFVERLFVHRHRRLRAHFS